MALTSDQITAQNFKDFYGQIRPYLNGSAHAGFTPVGTVISVMGKQAPLNYLVCDGTVYNIADYPELAAYFAGQFETCNFFGGNGTTTFAVPDLRGEFLRGAGTNGHENQGDGSVVGQHQDSTYIPYWRIDKENNYLAIGVDKEEGYDTPINFEKGFLSKKRYVFKDSATSGRYVDVDFNTGTIYGIRPTNTSVLYCIATKNIFMDAGSNLSIEERSVGITEDGEVLYEKTIIVTGNINNTVRQIAQIADIKNLRKYFGYLSESTYDYAIPDGGIRVFRNGANIYIKTIGTEAFNNTNGGKITIQYTKTTD